MEKVYNHRIREDKWHKTWQEKGFSIILPPGTAGGMRQTLNFTSAGITNIRWHAGFDCSGTGAPLHPGKDLPVSDVLVNGLIKSRAGAPLDIIQEYGADAFRFALASQAVPGMNTSLTSHRIKDCKTFVNKIWNASRYVLMNLKGDEDWDIDCDRISGTDKWFLHAINSAIHTINEHIDHHRLFQAARIVYRFFRREYCDWYLEFSKCDIENRQTRRVLKFTLFKLLKLLHPFMPFLTEEIDQKFDDGAAMLNQGEFPTIDSRFIFSEEFSAVERLKQLIAETRRTRAKNRIAPGQKIPIFIKTDSAKEKAMAAGKIKYFDFMTRSAGTGIVADFSRLNKGFKGSCQNWEILLPFANDRERQEALERLKKELHQEERQVARIENELDDPRFLQEAGSAAVKNARKRLQAALDRKEEIEKTIKDLS